MVEESEDWGLSVAKIFELSLISKSELDLGAWFYQHFQAIAFFFDFLKQGIGKSLQAFGLLALPH